jgi:hypothetical protein
MAALFRGRLKPIYIVNGVNKCVWFRLPGKNLQFEGDGGDAL